MFFHWNFWCNTQDAAQLEFCRDVLRQYRQRLVAERRERDARYALYRLRRRGRRAPARLT